MNNRQLSEHILLYALFLHRKEKDALPGRKPPIFLSMSWIKTSSPLIHIVS